ncbi:hypothetical protein FWJ25_03405 [Marinobacter salinexigens]|uniref:Lipoprotein n=1 Tax=Marinobacter salinexigens TaxID=2919747 RepID=A0A5B0VQE7_9GAMM|nr:hypothetical protein [Marinobacter salinexigens]KAA1176191.1 hypothetical protein FWJ25_03405 [Marinobacter salinexigens]
MQKTAPFLFSLMVLVLAGCQSLPEGPKPTADNTILLSSEHCLSEYLKDLDKEHYGPCLRITEVNGQQPAIRDDGFIELPVARALTLNTSCVYRHADGTPIPLTVETAEFRITNETFTKPGQRWYLHAQEQARGVIGCKPTLSRSIYPTYKTE